MTKLRNSRGGPFVSSISAVASVTTVTTGQCPQPRTGDGTNRFGDRMITPPGRSAEMIVYFVHFETINIIPGEQSKGRDIGPLTAETSPMLPPILRIFTPTSRCCLLRAHDFYKTRIDILRLVRALHCFCRPPSPCTISR